MSGIAGRGGGEPGTDPLNSYYITHLLPDLLHILPSSYPHRLIQIQQAKKEKEPTYTLLAEKGVPRRREFVMQVGKKFFQPLAFTLERLTASLKGLTRRLE